MTETVKNAGIVLADDSYTSEPVPVQVPNGGEMITLYVHQKGYMGVKALWARLAQAGDNKYSPMQHLFMEVVKDADGNQFTLEQIDRLKPEVAEPLAHQVAVLHNLIQKAEGAEKN